MSTNLNFPAFLRFNGNLCGVVLNGIKLCLQEDDIKKKHFNIPKMVKNFDLLSLSWKPGNSAWEVWRMDILTTLQILGLFFQHGLGEANVSRDVRVDARTHTNNNYAFIGAISELLKVFWVI